MSNVSRLPARPADLDDTVEIPAPWLLPPVSPSARAAARPPLSARVLRSQFAADVRAHGWMAGLLLAAVLAPLALGDIYVTWDGVHSIPTGGAK